ncbi:MAG TPA: MFS transporter [Aestuariivirgaceae bacterium]|nr:MFS transporter [Aestuariivirgaceae bacterium]
MTAMPVRTNPLFRLEVVIVAGCLIALVSFGVRSTAGLFTAPISEAHGWGREVYGLAMAMQNLVWGLATPFLGMLADKLGPIRVIKAGALFYAAGLMLMAFAETQFLVSLGGGVLMGLGIAATSFAIVAAAFGRLVPPEKRSWSFGIATAASSMGQFVFAPIGHAFIAAYGWQMALLLLAASCLLMILFAVPLGASKGGVAHGESEVDISLTLAIRHALGHPSFLLLVFGFFVCGFQIAFITVHLPPYLVERGMSPALAAWSIGIVGLFNIIGSYAAGVYGGYYSKRYGLAFIYFSRSVAVTAFLLAPISAVSTILFTAVMGLLWLSTVPLTMGLVTVMFGTRYMATLYGFAFFSHQVGSFLGVWLGGRFYDQYGSYDPVWWMGVALGLAAAVIHWPIREKRAGAFVVAPAQ